MEVDDPIGTVAADVTGVVETAILPRGDEELLLRGLRVIEVLHRQAVSGDMDPALDAVGALVEELVEHVHRLTRQRHSVGDVLLTGVIGHHVVDRPDTRLGGASQADELGAGEDRHGARRQRAGDDVARQQDELQVHVRRQLPGPAFLQEHLEQGGHGVPGVHAAGTDQLDPRARVPDLGLCRQDEGPCA